MIINIIIFSLWVWAFEGNLHLSGCGIAAQLFINKKNKVKINITGKWQHCPYPLSTRGALQQTNLKFF